EILSCHPVTISPQAALAEAMALMKSENVTGIVVVEGSHPVGVLTERDVLRILASGTSTETLSVGNAMSSPPITAPSDLDFFEAYHLCASQRIRHLVVVDTDGGLLGLASESDFLRILGIDVLSGDHSIDRDMIRLPLCLAPETPLLDALRRMGAESGGAAIAVVDNKPIGILSERDVIHFKQENLAGLRLADVMARPVLTIPLGASIYYAIDQMRSHRVRRLVVMNQDGEVAGLFTEHDAVKRIESRYVEFLSTVIQRQVNDLNAVRNKLNESAVLTSILRESLDMALVATDVDGIVRYLNPEAVNILGAGPSGAEGRRLDELAKQAGFGDQHIHMGMEAAKHGQRHQTELTYRQADGERVLRSQFAPITNESATVLGYVQTLQDITERKRAMLELQKSASIFENTQDGIVVTDAACNIVAVNPAFTKITGYSELDVLGRNPSMLGSGRQDAHFYQRMWQHLQQDGYWQGEIWNRNKNGDVYAEWLTINAVMDEGNAVVKYIGVFADITSLKKSQEEYEFLAHHDPLTGLANRLLCHARLAHALQRAKRRKEGVAVMMLDLDKFKLVNDTWGHQVGDHLLQEAARRITAALRSDDTAARLGGDEFVVVLESIQGRKDAAAIAKKLVSALSEDYVVDGVRPMVSVSIGIAMAPEHGTDVEILIERADQALYEVKAEGCNAFRFYEAQSALTA
ncbi:MAG: diguanylate cyclase domain-containing protein, partial [Methylomonas sp.]